MKMKQIKTNKQTSRKKINEIVKEKITTSTTYLDSRDKFFGDVMDTNYDVITLFLKCLHFEEA